MEPTIAELAQVLRVSLDRSMIEQMRQKTQWLKEKPTEEQWQGAAFLFQFHEIGARESSEQVADAELSCQSYLLFLDGTPLRDFTLSQVEALLGEVFGPGRRDEWEQRSGVGGTEEQI